MRKPPPYAHGAHRLRQFAGAGPADRDVDRHETRQVAVRERVDDVVVVQRRNKLEREHRTARAGREGEAIAFCSAEEVDLLLQIQKLMKIEIPVASGTMPAAVKDPTRGGNRGQRRGGGGRG